MLLLQVVLLQAALLLTVAARTTELLRVAVHAVRVVAPAASLPDWASMATVRAVHTATACCGGAVGEIKRTSRFVGWEAATARVAKVLRACAAAVRSVAVLLLWAMCCRALDRRGEGTVARHAGGARKWRERC